MSEVTPSGRRSHGVAWLDRLASPLSLLVVALCCSAGTYFVVLRLGTQALTLLLLGMFVGIVLVILSGRHPEYVVAVWFLVMSGFHTTGMVRMPGLPDFSFARMMLIWVGAMLVFRFIVQGRRLPGPYMGDTFLAVYTAYLMLQVLYIGGAHFHNWYLSTLTPFAAYIFGKTYITQEKQIRNFLVAMVLLNLYYGITSIGEHYHIAALVWPKEILDPSVGKFWWGRTRGPFLQSALFGQIIGMLLLVQVVLLVRRQKMVWRTASMVSLPVTALGLYYTYTRGGWVATAVGLLTIGVLRPGFRKFLIGAAVVGALAGGLGLVSSSDDEFLQERVENTGTIENRLQFMASSLRMIQDHPIFGVGYFQYTVYREQYVRGTYVPLYGFIKRKLGADVVPHDIYLGRLVEEGILSIICLAMFFISIVRSFIIKWRRHPDLPWFNRDVMALFAGIILSYMAGGLAIDFRYFDLVNVIPYFLGGIIVGYRNDLFEQPVAARSPGRESVA